MIFIKMPCFIAFLNQKSDIKKQENQLLKSRLEQYARAYDTLQAQVKEL